MASRARRIRSGTVSSAIPRGASPWTAGEGRPDAEAGAAEGSRRSATVRERTARALLMANSSSAAKTGQLQLALSWKAIGATRRAAAAVRRRRVPRLLAERRRRHPAVPLQPARDHQQGRRRDLRRRRHPVQCDQLILNHGWTGLLVDGGEERFAAAAPSSRRTPTRSRSRRPSRANGSTARRSTTSSRSTASRGEIDLLSIDLDGVDYWVWEAARRDPPARRRRRDACIWGADAAVTVPYARDFQAPLVDGFGIYRRRQPAGLRQARAPQGLPAGRRAGARLQRLLRARRPRHRPAAGSERRRPPASTGPSCAGRPRASCRSSATRPGSRSSGGSAPLT